MLRLILSVVLFSSIASAEIILKPGTSVYVSQPSQVTCTAGSLSLYCECSTTGRLNLLLEDVITGKSSQRELGRFTQQFHCEQAKRTYPACGGVGIIGDHLKYCVCDKTNSHVLVVEDHVNLKVVRTTKLNKFVNEIECLNNLYYEPRCVR